MNIMIKCYGENLSNVSKRYHLTNISISQQKQNISFQEQQQKDISDTWVCVGGRPFRP